jgi:hypothetical protein
MLCPTSGCGTTRRRRPPLRFDATSATAATDDEHIFTDALETRSVSPESAAKRTSRAACDFSQIDPNVWPGRASQEVFVELAVNGLASMYPASNWSSSCSGPSWISARVRSHYRTGLNGPLGSPVLAGAGKTDPPFILILSQTFGGLVVSVRRHLAFDAQAGQAVASPSLLASKLRPRARTLQATRASLLASAMASTLRCNRFLAASSQGLSP